MHQLVLGEINSPIIWF